MKNFECQELSMQTLLFRNSYLHCWQIAKYFRKYLSHPNVSLCVGNLLFIQKSKVTLDRFAIQIDNNNNNNNNKPEDSDNDDDVFSWINIHLTFNQNLVRDNARLIFWPQTNLNVSLRALPTIVAEATFDIVFGPLDKKAKVVKFSFVSFL